MEELWKCIWMDNLYSPIVSNWVNFYFAKPLFCLAGLHELNRGKRENTCMISRFLIGLFPTIYDSLFIMACWLEIRLRYRSGVLGRRLREHERDMSLCFLLRRWGVSLFLHPTLRYGYGEFFRGWSVGGIFPTLRCPSDVGSLGGRLILAILSLLAAALLASCSRGFHTPYLRRWLTWGGTPLPVQRKPGCSR